MAPTAAAPAGGFRPEALRQMQQLATWTDAFRRTMEAYTQLSDQLTDQLKPIWSVLDRLGPRLAAGIEEQTRALPDNWRGHSVKDLLALRELADSGYTIAWISRFEVLTALKAAATTDRGEVLDSRKADVLEDCEAILDQITNHQDLVDAVGETVTLLRDGRIRPAQALATNVFDAALREAIPPVKIARYDERVKDWIAARPADTVRLYRCAATFWPATSALGYLGPSDPTPDKFNRHATAHRVDSVQYTSANSLVSLLLATSILREITQEDLEQSATDAEVKS